MNVGQVTAQILKREGVEFLLTYPLNSLTERCAEVDIRPIVVRQERDRRAHGRCHRPPLIGRQGRRVRLPGRSRASKTPSAPWRRPGPRACRWSCFPSGGGSFIKPAFNATLNFQHITKHAEIVHRPEQIVPALRRAFSIARNGRPGPVLIEVAGIWGAEVPGRTELHALAPHPLRAESEGRR